MTSVHVRDITNMIVSLLHFECESSEHLLFFFIFCFVFVCLVRVVCFYFIVVPFSVFPRNM